VDKHRRRRLRGCAPGEHRAERHGVAGPRTLDGRYGRLRGRPAHGATGRPEPLGILEGALENPDASCVRLNPYCCPTGRFLLNLEQSRLGAAFLVFGYPGACQRVLFCIATLDE
jgi:hypothetical protein